MEEVFIGDVIKRRRMELKLTQEQLCEGICEPITISRLETGKHIPSYGRIKALLERLDLPANRFFALLSKNEQDVEALQKQIVALNLRFEHSLGEEKARARAEALQAHEKLEAIIDKDDRISRQIILRSRVILGKDDSPYSPEEQRSMLLEAIRLTCPSFDPDDIARGLYTTDEIKIINQLAIIDCATGSHSAAVETLSQLYKYIHKHFHGRPVTRAHLNLVIFNYATELYEIGEYEKAIELAEEGRELCIGQGHYQMLPGLLEVMADCYRLLGDSEKSKGLYYQSYYTCKALRKDRDAEITRREIQEYFGLEVEC